MAKTGQVRSLILLVAAAALTTTLAACGTPSNAGASSSVGSDLQSAASASPTLSASASVPDATAADTATATDTTSTSAASGAPGLCNAAMLTGSVDDTGGGAAGHVYMKLILKNTSTQSCILDGYPGVSLVGSGSGTQVGAPANRDPALPSAGPLTLNPGSSATAQLRYTQAGNYQDCTQTPAEGLRVYPPSATDALFIRHPLTGCSQKSIVLLTIGAFRAS